LGAYNLAALITISRWKNIFTAFIIITLFFLPLELNYLCLVEVAVISIWYQYLLYKDRIRGYSSEKIFVISLHVTPWHLPKEKRQRMSPKKAMLCSLLLALYSLIFFYDPKDFFQFNEKLEASFSILICFGCATIRLFSYMRHNYCCGIFFRLRYLLLWDKRYDKVFMTPILIICIGLFTTYLVYLLPALNYIIYPTGLLGASINRRIQHALSNISNLLEL